MQWGRRHPVIPACRWAGRQGHRPGFPRSPTSPPQTPAGVGRPLTGAKRITGAEPADGAFEARDQPTRNKALAAPKGLLTTVLTHHGVQGRLTPAMLAGTEQTLQGKTLTVAGSGEDFTVNGTAKVVCGNVQTANATVYIIDGVLLPPAK